MARPSFPAVLAAAVLLLSACGGDQPGDAGAGSDDQPVSHLLRHVPADTPYVAANLTPIPEPVMDKMWSAAEPMLALAQEQIERGLTRLADDPTLDRDERLARAVMAELSGKLSREGLRSLGMDFRYVAVYSSDVLPVFRLSLSDGQAFQAALDRIEAAAGEQFVVNEAAGQTYYDVGDDKARLLISPQADQLVIALAPAETAIRQAMVDAVVGATLPVDDVTARLREVNAQYELLPSGTVLVDTVAIFDRMMNAASPVSGALFEDLREELSPACRDEVRGFLATIPRFVSGNRVLEADRIEQYSLLEMEPALAGDLASTAIPMPGLTNSDEGAVYVAFGVNVMELRRVLSERIAAHLDDPMQCERSPEFTTRMTRAQQQLSQPIPPFIGNFQGIRVMIEDFELGETRPRARGMAMAAMANPQIILGMAQTFVPELAQLNLSMDGQPQPLPQGLVPDAELEAPHIAMTPAGIAMSVGEGQADRLQDFLNAPKPSGVPPFLVFSYDAARMAAIQEEMMARGQANRQDDLVEFEAKLKDALRGYYAVFGRVSGELRFTNRGLEIESATTLN